MILDYLGPKKPVLFGRDFGAICVALCKVKYPARVGALILQDCIDNVTESARAQSYLLSK